MGGVTSAISAPTGGSISGQASMINTAGWTNEDLVVKKGAAMVVNLGGGGGGGRGGRGGGGGPTGDLPGFMKAAQDYDAKRAAGQTHIDLSYEAMRPLLHKEIPALIQANGEQAIRQAVEFGDTYGVKVVIVGGADAWRVRTLLAQKNVPVVLSSLQAAPAFNQPYDAVYAQPGLLAEAGVKIAFSANDANARHVWEHAALAEAYGLAPDAALKAVTIWPAEMWGVDKEIGSIAQGKMANLLVTTGDPLDLRTQLVHIFIKGRDVPADDRQSRLYLKYKARPRPPTP
jgi:imidazolonepropionase-like amidohydrolase